MLPAMSSRNRRRSNEIEALNFAKSGSMPSANRPFLMPDDPLKLFTVFEDFSMVMSDQYPGMLAFSGFTH